jgi:lipopolysaccharide export system permease protein
LIGTPPSGDASGWWPGSAARYTHLAAPPPVVAKSRPHYRLRTPESTFSRPEPRPVLTRLDRYLLRETTLSFVAVTGVLLVILLSNQLARVLGQAVKGDFPGSVVLALLGLTTLQQLTVLLPLGLFLGIVLALGRLYHESEMTAMAACGVGTARIYRPILLLTAVVVAVLALLSFRVMPAAGIMAQQIRATALRAAQFGSLEPGRFRTFAGGDVVFYAERVLPSGQLEGVFVQRRDGDRIELAVAERAEQRGAGQSDQLFVLFNGRRYEGVPGSPEWRVVEFEEHGVAVRMPEMKTKGDKLSIRPTRVLLQASGNAERSELAWRTAMPLMALVLMLLAVPLAKLAPRKGRFSRVGFAIIAYFLYSNLLAAVRAWMEKGNPAGAFGMWWVHMLPLIAAAWLIWRDEHPGRLWRRTRGGEA